MSSLRTSYHRLVRRAGGGMRVTLRRRNTLRSSTQGGLLTTLAMAGAALAGATTINLDAANLSGVLRKGCQFTIAGVSGTYTAQADVTAASGVLTGVTISPALAGNAANEAAVTITQPYGDYTFVAARARQGTSTGDKTAQLGRVRFHLSAVGASTAPSPGDLLVESDGTTERIGAVHTRRPGSTTHGWTVELGEAEAKAS